MLVKALGDNLYRDDRKKEEFDALAETVISMSVGDMESNIQNYLELQVDKYLECISKESAGIDITQLSSNCVSPAMVPDFCSRMHKAMNWGLSLNDSSIPDAGTGVFLEGHVRPGTLLTVIPGTVYLRQHIVDPQFFGPLTKDKSDYKYWNYDGLIVDSTEYSANSPMGFGHKINHPSKPDQIDLKPNVMVVPYEFSKKQGDRYGHLIPNRYISPEKFMYKVANNHILPNGFVRTMGIISISEIDNEELFLDYRLPPKAQPGWYKQIDDSTLRRWNIMVEADAHLHVESE